MIHFDTKSRGWEKRGLPFRAIAFQKCITNLSFENGETGIININAHLQPFLAWNVSLCLSLCSPVFSKKCFYENSNIFYFDHKTYFHKTVTVDTNMTSTLREGGVGKTKMRCYRTQGSGGLVSVLDVQSLFFVIKENWICAMTRYHTEPKINISLTRNLPYDCDVRQWSHRLMIPLHYLWAKSNNITCGQFECNVSWFCFCFDFVHSYSRCRCCSAVCFQVAQNKAG